MNLSLYIHLPFCYVKCFYCSFASFEGKGSLVDPYLAALRKEAGRYEGARVSTVYIGGGTPTTLSGAQLEVLFDMVRSIFRLDKDAEVTVEANPATFDAEKAALLRRRGVNRLSLGVQSLSDHYLKYLGRAHTRAQAISAFGMLRNAGFENINTDLMYSLPGQSEEDIARDLEDLLALEGEHVSLYTLAVEKGSEFYRQKTNVPSAERQGEYFRLAKIFLARRGLRHYEVSNFARPGFECRHNLNYWRGGDYIGLGAAAHSHLEGKRSWNISDLKKYLVEMEHGGSAQAGEEKLEGERRLMELLLIGLRMTDGVCVREMQEKARVRLPEEKERRIQEFVRKGLLVFEKDRLAATEEGVLVLDELCARLI